MLQSEHHSVTALSVESWPGVLQMIQKNIKRWMVGLEAEMGFPVSDAYSLPIITKSLVGSVIAIFCGIRYPLHISLVKVSSHRVMINMAFSVPIIVDYNTITIFL